MTIRADQGSQFTSKELDLWAYANGITLDFSRPGKPTDNAYLESFNATVRLECLGRHWFLRSLPLSPEPSRDARSSKRRTGSTAVSQEEDSYANSKLF